MIYTDDLVASFIIFRNSQQKIIDTNLYTVNRIRKFFNTILDETEIGKPIRQLPNQLTVTLMMIIVGYGQKNYWGLKRFP